MVVAMATPGISILALSNLFKSISAVSLA
jgi:hypothetical protein